VSHTRTRHQPSTKTLPPLTSSRPSPTLDRWHDCLPCDLVRSPALTRLQAHDGGYRRLRKEARRNSRRHPPQSGPPAARTSTGHISAGPPPTADTTPTPLQTPHTDASSRVVDGLETIEGTTHGPSTGTRAPQLADPQAGLPAHNPHSLGSLKRRGRSTISLHPPRPNPPGDTTQARISHGAPSRGDLRCLCPLPHYGKKNLPRTASDPHHFLAPLRPPTTRLVPSGAHREHLRRAHSPGG